MYEPLIGIFLGVGTEDDEGFVLPLFALQLPRIKMHLQRSGLIQSFVDNRLGLIFFAHRFEDLRLGQQIVIALFHPDGLVFIFERLFQINFAGEEIVSGIIPAVLGILRQSTQLFLQAGFHHVIHLH